MEEDPCKIFAESACGSLFTPDELSLIDNFRYEHRMPTRAAAVRELLKMGLAAKSTDGDGSRSQSLRRV